MGLALQVAKGISDVFGLVGIEEKGRGNEKVSDDAEDKTAGEQAETADMNDPFANRRRKFRKEQLNVELYFPCAP